jgi:hypothetical protein
MSPLTVSVIVMPKSRGRRNSKKPLRRNWPTQPTAPVTYQPPPPAFSAELEIEPSDDELYQALTARGWAASRDEDHSYPGDGDSFDWEPSRPPAHLIAPDKYGELTTIHVTDTGYDVHAPQLDDRLTPAESHYATRDELLADIDRIEALRYSPTSTGDAAAVHDRHL